MKEFLDLSNWNDIKSFDGIKNNYCGVICKATEGTTYKDATFDWKIQNLKSNNINVGAYHFLTASSSPNTQALNFYNAIKSYELDFIPVLDAEQDSVDEYMCRQFIKEFKRLSGKDLVIYSGAYFIKNKFSLEFRKENKFWVASYGSGKPDIEGVNMLAWQYTDAKQVEGVGKCDCSYLYDENFLTNNEIPFQSDYDDEYVEHGIAHVQVDGLRIRRSPSLTGEVVGSYNKGEQFIYNYVIINDGYVWCRYTGNSGNICYVAVRRLSDNKRYAICY